jgi:hypothetical protein
MLGPVGAPGVAITAEANIYDVGDRQVRIYQRSGSAAVSVERPPPGGISERPSREAIALRAVSLVPSALVAS